MIPTPTPKMESNSQPNSPPERPSTLFPKITGKVAEIGHNYVDKIRAEKGADKTLYVDIRDLVLPLIGTVKLHGAHVDLVIDSANTITIQSRNVVGLRSGGKDVYGVAVALEPLGREILALRDRYHERFRALNPDIAIKGEYPTIIAGEWIGPGIQKNVAISQLPRKSFVILSVCINNSWLPDEPYANLDAEEVGIYNISRAGFFHSTLHLGSQPSTRARLEVPTLEVERECPFAKSLGISGIGEGIVWKVAHPLGADPRFWLKTKGPLHAVTNTGKMVQSKKGMMGDSDGAWEFASAAVTEARLEQGWAYLEEVGIQREMKSMKRFLEWIVGDVVVEEKSVIEELGLEGGLVNKCVEAVARRWYVARVKGEDGY